MSRSLTGYALTGHFRKLRARYSFTHLEAYLFFELVACCNDEGWAEEFSVSNPLLCATLGVSEKGLIKARKTLVDAGLVTFEKGVNRKPTVYRFCLPKGLPEVRDSNSKYLPQVRNTPPEPLPESLPEVRDLTAKPLPEGLPEGLPEVSPLYKEEIKTKTLSEGAGESAQVLAPSEGSRPAKGKTKKAPLTPPTPAEQLPADSPLADLLNVGGLASRVQQLAEPLTSVQAQKLLADYGEPAVCDIFCQMANYRNLLSASTSANLTARNWLNKRRQSEVDLHSQSGHPLPPPTTNQPLSLETERNEEFEAQLRARQQAEDEARAKQFRATYASTTLPAP